MPFEYLLMFVHRRNFQNDHVVWYKGGKSCVVIIVQKNNPVYYQMSGIISCLLCEMFDCGDVHIKRETTLHVIGKP